MIRTKRNIKPLRVKLSPSQVKLINQGYKDADGVLFFPFAFQKVKDSEEYEMVHFFDLHPATYARLITMAVETHIAGQKTIENEPWEKQ